MADVVAEETPVEEPQEEISTGESKDEAPSIVLVAQRHPQDQNFARAVLSQLGGFRVAEAQSASGIVQALRVNPDIILVDPAIKGNFIKVVELMRRMPKLNHVGIAVLSGDQEGVERCVGKGFNGYIMKPYTPEILLASVWQILSKVPPLPGDGSPAKLEIELDQIEGLPTLPTVYAEVEALCKDPNVDADKLAKVIETDPSITMKLLKLSNSAFFGFKREIRAIKDSVALLGNETVQQAVLSISVFEALKDQEESAGLDKKEFWRHSAATGSIVRFICKKMRVQREDAFTSGILHDVGKVILDSMFAQFYKTVFDAIDVKKMHIFEAEESTLGVVHTKLGQELAESWGIPERLIEAIAHHHNPKVAELDCELASLVHIADAVARNLGVGSGGDSYIPCIHTFALEQLAVTSDDLIGWEEEMLKAMEKDMSFLAAIA